MNRRPTISAPFSNRFVLAMLLLLAVEKHQRSLAISEPMARPAAGLIETGMPPFSILGPEA
ncbi:MAG: hypothetical protein J6386_24695 [Candidatus Synoicihabitans palmerolidicus]|nr:hypothetical protein [Candidatus Synoicihabitans palmerolidicus]